MSHRERLAGKSPSIGFSHCPVEVVDEIHEPLPQSLHRRKVAALDDASYNHAELARESFSQDMSV